MTSMTFWLLALLSLVFNVNSFATDLPPLQVGINDFAAMFPPAKSPPMLMRVLSPPID